MWFKTFIEEVKNAEFLSPICSRRRRRFRIIHAWLA